MDSPVLFCRVAFFLLVPILTIFPGPSRMPAPDQDAAIPATPAAGPPVECELSAGANPRHRLRVEANSYLALVVSRVTVDVGATVFGPRGDKVAAGSGRIEAVLAEPGEYTVEITPRKAGTGGRYTIAVEALRPATQKDTDRIRAGKLRFEGLSMAQRNSSEAFLKGIELCTEAATLFNSVGMPVEEAECLSAVGYFHGLLGDRRASRDLYQRALAVVRTGNDARMEEEILLNLASAYVRLGELQPALEAHDEVLSKARANGHLSQAARASFNFGALYQKLGDPERGMPYFEEALEIYRRLGDDRGESLVLANIGSATAALGETRKAIDFYLRALAILKQRNTVVGQAPYVTSLGRLYNRVGDRTKAREYLTEALSLSRAGGDRSQEAIVLEAFGLVAGDSGDSNEAFRRFDEALTLYRAVENKAGEAGLLFQRAKLARNVGDLERARADIDQAIDIVEVLRSRIGVPSLRASYLGMIRDYYELSVDVLMRLHERRPDQGFDTLALRTSELGKARALLESLSEAYANPERSGVDPTLVERERALRRQLNVRADRLAQLPPKQEAQRKPLLAELETLREQYESLQGEIRRAHPRFAALTQPAALDVADFRERILDEGTVLLEYALGEQRGYLWAVTKKDVKTFVLPGRDDIEGIARRTYQLLTERNRRVKFETIEERRERIAKADAAFPSVAESLAQLILWPVADLIADKRVLIVADGALQYIPFAALPFPTNTGNSAAPFLVERCEVVTLPSAATLAVLRRELDGRRPAPKLAAVLADPVFSTTDERLLSARGGKPDGDVRRATDDDLVRAVTDISADPVIPRLPYTRREARAIGRFVPADAFLQALDFSANRATATDPALGRYRIVHFATHGILNSRHPELSGLILSTVDEQGRPRDGFFRTHELYGLKLPADLVVLSGCRTGLGKEIRGEGLVGMTRGFMYAGAARVMVSLWDVSDEGTAELMEHFYRDLLGKRPRGPAAALRSAQVALAKSKRWSHPYFWAGFVLQGEPR